MNIIFLDIDGVLNDEQWLRSESDRMSDIVEAGKMNRMSYHYAKIKPQLVKNLNRIIYATDAKIVVSSAWRIYGWEMMKLILREVGVEGEVISVTGKRPPNMTRGACIRTWLNNHHGYTGEPEPNYVVIDDSDDMQGIDYDRFVHTVFQDGLTEDKAAEAIGILTHKR